MRNLLLGLGILYLFTGCSNSVVQIQNKIKTLTPKKIETKVLISGEHEDLYLKPKVKESKLNLDSQMKKTSNGLIDSFSNTYRSNYIINDKIFQTVNKKVRLREYTFKLIDVENKKTLLTLSNLDRRSDIITFDDTLNNMIYIGVRNSIGNIGKLYNFDGVKLNMNRVHISLNFKRIGFEFKHKIISKYIISDVDDENSVLNISNNNRLEFEGSILYLKNNKALVYRSLGNSIFKNKQYQLLSINLDNGNETILTIEDYNNQYRYKFYETDTQLIVSLSNKQNINIMNLKNVYGDLSQATQLQTKIYSHNLSGEEKYSTMNEYDFTLTELETSTKKLQNGEILFR